MPLDSETLATQWVHHFWAQDSLLRWTEIEAERHLWINDNTLLLGRIDAQGLADETPFFADWKTLSARMVRRVGEVKAEYEFSPQMLTYQVLCPMAKRYLVRWACKTDVPSYHWQWYDCSDKARRWWLNLIRNISYHIHFDLSQRSISEMPDIPWNLRLSSCRSKYGPAYDCPYLPGCSKQEWSYVPRGYEQRGSHLAIERQLQTLVEAGVDKKVEFLGKIVDPREVLVLDATRIATWMACDERYRHEYHDGPDSTGWRLPESPERDKGTDFHDLLHKYYASLRDRS